MNYKIKENIHFSEVSEDFSIACMEKGGVLLKSKVAREILEIISERSVTKDELLRDYFTASSINEAVISLYQLEKEGIITSSPSVFTSEQSGFWIEMGYDPLRLLQVFEEKKVSIECIGQVSKSTLEKACKETGIQFSQTPTLTIVITDSYTNAKLWKYNQKFLEEKTPWLLIKTAGSEPLVGPLFIPGKEDAACWKCLEHRLLLHDRESQFYQALNQTGEHLTRPFISHPLSEGLVVHAAVLEVVSWLYKDDGSLQNKIISFDLKSGEKRINHLVKRPQCEACGDQELQLKPPSPIVLQQQKMGTDVAGGYRAVTAEETLERNEHHVSEITGVVPHLRPYYWKKNTPVYNFSSGRNLALQSNSMFWLNKHLRSINGGKGKNPIQAKVGALCESIERYSLMFHDKRHVVKGAFKDLEKAIHPNQCMLYSDKQYDEREQTNRNSFKFYSLTPNVFNEDEVMDWTSVYSLTNEEFKLLPSEYCYAQYPTGDREEIYSYPDSNGCAAGNTMEEAILQGFLELVERDAAAIWWYNMLQRPGVDLASAQNPYIDQMIDFYKGMGRSVYVLDLTTDMNIPVFVALSHNLSQNSKDEVVYAFGAHVDAAIALERAIVELNQLAPVITTDRDVIEDKACLDWLRDSSLEEHKYLAPVSGKLKNMQTDYPKVCEANIYESVQYCIKMAKQNQLETLVHDLTQPDIGMPVAKVIVPGMRHFWRRTAPGRLYDVPVKMGWLSKANTEETLNPISIFI